MTWRYFDGWFKTQQIIKSDNYHSEEYPMECIPAKNFFFFFAFKRKVRKIFNEDVLCILANFAAVMSRAGVALLIWQPPPEQLEPSGPSIDIRRGTVIINGPSVTLHSPQGRLWCLEPEWLSSHGSPPLTCRRPTDPPLEFARGAWSPMAHWSLPRVPRERCDVKRARKLALVSPPPTVLFPRDGVRWKRLPERWPHAKNGPASSKGGDARAL